MMPADWFQVVLYLVVLLALVKPLGAYIAAVHQGQRTVLSPVLQPVERATATSASPMMPCLLGPMLGQRL